MVKNEQRKIWVWTATSNQDRADTAILNAFEKKEGRINSEFPPTLSRSQIQRLIESGHVTLNGAQIKPNTRIKIGNTVELVFPDPKPIQLTPENQPIDILYEDEHLLVVNKPPGLTVHPSPTQMEGTLVHILLHHIKDLSGIGGVLRPGIVHRLDKDTSGALVVSKTDAAHAKLTEIFSTHSIERVYWALCYGAPPLSENFVRIESLIGRNPKDRKKMSMKVKAGRKAITYFIPRMTFSLASQRPFASALEIKLETGRTHQIRVHLTGIGYSLLGDPTYGTPTSQHPKWLALPEDVKSAVKALSGQALHAQILGFTHPITQEKLRFEAKPPEPFLNLLKICQNYSIKNS